MTVMAMTLRTDDELDAALNALAEAEGRSKQDIVRLAVLDRYGRTVARVECRGSDANLEMVKAGMAWAFTKYQTDPAFPRAELVARQAGVGMWGDSTPAAQTSPWHFRHTPQPLMADAIGCITGPKGGRYRVLPDGRKQYGC